MKDLLKAVLIFSVLVAFTNCNQNELSSAENVTIDFGTVCGWCGGTEFITITPSNIEYIRTIPCGDGEGTVKNERMLNPGEWDEITGSFNYSRFKKLNYSECNVCVDGCDEIIKIAENHNLHKISYSPSTEIKEISGLQQILKSKLEEMRE